MATTTKTNTNTKAATKTKKVSKTIFKGGHGRMCVKATFNTTYVSFTSEDGAVICWSSAGTSGFKGARRSTPFAATTIIEDGLKKAKALNLTSLDVYIKGPGPGRDAAMRVLKNAGIDINMIADVTPIPHNGCRPKKPRRV